MSSGFDLVDCHMTDATVRKTQIPSVSHKMPPYDLKWKVDECSDYIDRMKLAGWCCASGPGIDYVEAIFNDAAAPIRLKSYGLPSPDVAASILPEASHARFSEWISLKEEQRAQDFTLRFHLRDGSIHESEYVNENARAGDCAHECWYHFLDLLNTLHGGEVLELGSRARSAITRKSLIPSGLRYVGLDIVPGPNVDIVGDAHGLSTLFERKRFKAVFALSVFEHLAMPWKVVAEMNRVMALGGYAFVLSPQTYPLHDEPWDFCRFSIHAWRCLFNPMTGFEVVRVAHGEPARIHPLWDAPALSHMCSYPSYLSSAVIARKVTDTHLNWDVSPSVATQGSYPPENLPASP